jgi:hypothetical protein
MHVRVTAGAAVELSAANGLLIIHIAPALQAGVCGLGMLGHNAALLCHLA